MADEKEGARAFAMALAASDGDGAVRAMVAALERGVEMRRLERGLLKVMAAQGEELHSMVYVSAAFDLAAGLGPEAGKYPLAAAAMQVARQPKNTDVAERVAEVEAQARSTKRPASIAEAERSLGEALDRRDSSMAIAEAVALHHLTGDGPYVIETFAKWAGRPEVLEAPAGYVSHLPLQIDAASNLLAVAKPGAETDLLLGHLAYCQVQLSQKYTARRVGSGPSALDDAGDALTALRAAIHGRKLEELRGLIAVASAGKRGIDEVGRTLMRCGLEAEGGLSHRFTLAGAAWRTARAVHPSVGRALLHHAALSIANGYAGPRRLLELRDLPHPNPGGRDYAGRLLVGLASGHLPEAHAALRGLFEGGTSPRAAALPFLDAASQLDASKLHTDHGFILTQAAWRAIHDGSFAGEALPMLAELAARIAKAPKDHALIAAVEDASAAAPNASH